MTSVKKIIKWIGLVLAIPLMYLVISLMLSWITVNSVDSDKENTETIYLSTNGVHLNIILNKTDMNRKLLNGLLHHPSEKYLSIGWGDEQFYLNTPTWSDLTFNTAFQALFLKGPSLMHIARYTQVQAHWVEIRVSNTQLELINELILSSFQTDDEENKILLPGKGYTPYDDFYKATGSYSCFKTCNSWVNTVFKKSGLKSCLWTPFDFGLLQKYK